MSSARAWSAIVFDTRIKLVRRSLYLAIDDSQVNVSEAVGRARRMSYDVELDITDYLPLDHE